MEDPKHQYKWLGPESYPEHNSTLGPFGQACQCIECQRARNALGYVEPGTMTEDPKAEDPKPDKLWPESEELRSLREQLVTARAEAKRHFTDKLLYADKLNEKDTRIRQLLESQADDGRRHFQHLAELGRQISASQDLSRALTWALQQAYRASTIRGEDS